MKRTLLIVSLCMLAGAVLAQTKSEQELLTLSKKKFQWMTTMNFDSLESVLDDRMVFIHSNGWAETKTEFIHDIQSGKLRYKNIDVLEASARIYPASAIIIGRGKFTVMLDGKPLEFDLKYTEVYIQKNGTWWLASRHANRLQ